MNALIAEEQWKIGRLDIDSYWHAIHYLLTEDISPWEECQIPYYLVKQLATEGVISKSEYQLLMNALPLRNSIAHGFKTTQITQNSVSELIELTEQLLRTVHTDDEAG
ncbi:MAG: hypothetical protein RMY64_32595 [Nostoc sp. DedQUE08]|uniref:hypothetical protein n=1 Tax=unclassified Nostoc TaxID=2593658 RepID=UPI002AD3D305|nr:MULTISPECIES: hypothetical protein [unclassified Nostoc]MDZ8070296.1 hypothetical protein [Nostoc sp. DedQUE08]MDZ8094089.1 hypothetical protein [Nostoc sp. DedQUE05]MDZ8127337.1 hypothetical protein [Nostoc sp. DedQUE07]